MKYRIVPVTKRGEKVWVIDVAATPDEPRQRIFRKTKREAEQEARDRFGEAEEFSHDLRNFSHRERLFLRYWLDRMSIEQLEELVAKAAGSKHEAVLIRDAVAAYLSAPRERPLSKRHTDDMRLRLAQFSKVFGSELIHSIDRGKLEDYIRSKGGSAPNHYRILRGLFFYAVRREWVRENPVKLIRRPEATQDEKGTLTPEQMTKILRICAGKEPGILFRSNREPITERYDPLLRLLIAGGFCGLRHSEVMRLDCAQVDAARGEIHVTKMKTAAKGVRERYVTVPENARAWLQWLNLPASGPYVGRTERNIRARRDALVKAIKLEDWPHNVLRRSFGSYHIAAYQNAAITAELMGHTDAQTTQSKYRVTRRKEIAEAWFSLTPEAVLGSAVAPAQPVEPSKSPNPSGDS